MVVARCIGGRPNTFITLSSNPNWLSSPEERAANLVKAWRTIRRRACKKYGYRSIPFLAVFEATKRGEPHLHILARCRWIDQKWLSDQWTQETGAWNVWVERVTTDDHAHGYCAKYLGKEPHRFAGTKRFWTSLDWQLESARLGDDGPVLSDRWTKYNMPLAKLAFQLRADGYEVEFRRSRVYFRERDPP
jgi:hypothetical protein